METKIKVENVQERTSTKTGKPYYTFMHEGKQVSCYEKLIAGQEYEGDLKQNDAGYWTFNLKKAKTGFAPNPKANRIAALNAAVEYAGTRPEMKGDHITTLADKFFEWISR